MPFEVLSNEELQNITGMKRYSAQVTWFKENFRVDPVRRPDGSIVLTKAAFELLLAKRLGVTATGTSIPELDRPQLRPLADRKNRT